ncbi:MAG: glucose-6-phosphate isomerase [Bacteroidales bacterium]|jgi:glucose-6-phosphate isomerase
MSKITVDLEYTTDFLPKQALNLWASDKKIANHMLTKKWGKGNDFLGWLSLPEKSLQQLPQILSAVKEFSAGLEAVVVIGIGGSYLGARAAIDSLTGPFGLHRPGPEILYAGHHLVGKYYIDLLEYLKTKKWGIVVVSKSGTTTEPAIAFRILKKALESQVDKATSARRIIAITDEKKGALRKLSTQLGYRTFVIPDDVGGRYSVLSPVGLVPIAIAGFSVEAMLQGAREMQMESENDMKFDTDPVARYATVRNAFYHQGKGTEVLCSFNPELHYIAEWWKQLFGESEGKEGKGIFPAVAEYTTDLHSMGQYMQEGPRNLFETILIPKKVKADLPIPEDTQDLDGLNFLAGKSLSYVNDAACQGTTLAHHTGGVPVIRISFDAIDENSLGSLFYFFEKSCAISGYLLGVNPFDQPGVELYKNNMFKLLKKPGY